MAADIIRYDLLVQDAMRGVMRKVLSDVAENGYLPGEHHFTISFLTHAPGVEISRRLAEQWPHELTIILQHQYSNLEVDTEGFGVTLSFRSMPEHLYIPFSAVTGFFDPSVEFGLRFETADEAPAAEETDSPSPDAQNTLPSDAKIPFPPEASRKAAPKTDAGEAAQTGDAPNEAKVISIDAFRKKT
jgi:hypothetical protein